MEMGVGIHGEPGRQRMNMKTAAEISEHWCRYFTLIFISRGVTFSNG
jgi:dihydroxyacetone kinase